MPVFLIGTLAALAGIGLATIIWLKPILKIEKLEPAFGWLAKIVENKYYIDEIYQATIIRALMLAAAVMYWFDKWVIDYCDRERRRLPHPGRVERVGLVRQNDRGRPRQPGRLDHRGSSGDGLRYLQTGVAQQYVFLLVVRDCDHQPAAGRWSAIIRR